MRMHQLMHMAILTGWQIWNAWRHWAPYEINAEGRLIEKRGNEDEQKSKEREGNTEARHLTNRSTDLVTHESRTPVQPTANDIQHAAVSFYTLRIQETNQVISACAVGSLPL